MIGIFHFVDCASCFTVLCLLTFIFQGTFAQNDNNPCFGKGNCQDCIQTDGHCAWCSAYKEKASAAPVPLCHYVEHLNASDRCLPSALMYPSSRQLSISKNEELSIENQIKPQGLQIQLRPGQPLTFQLNFRQAHDYPLDIYFLMDMSKTMLPYRDSLAELASTLVAEMGDITTNFTLGFGSFVDKPTMPFTKRPAGDKTLPCEECTALTYGFKHHMTLENNQTDRFKTFVKNANLSANLDHAEGGLDALMQVVVCKKEIGWRNESRKLVVFLTDAGSHYAGEGKLAAIVLPNDGECHLEKDREDDTLFYTHTLLQDYPSVGEIRSAIRKNNVNVIFAVTQEHQELYRGLSQHIYGSVVGLLGLNKSNNIVQIVKDEYNKITSSVEIKDTVPRERFKISYRSSCVNQPSLETAICHGLGARTKHEVSWNVTIELIKCENNIGLDSNMSVRFYPSGLNDHLIVNIAPLCHCDCQRESQREINSSSCSTNGDLECGLCQCNKGYEGNNCEDLVDISNRNNTENCIDPNSIFQCHGRGRCVRGICKCDPRTLSYGKYCECSNHDCGQSNGQLCGGEGHGTCECGKCKCKDGWNGTVCDCPTSNKDCLTKNKKECNGKGSCVCGKCKCDDTHEGAKCETCRTCPRPCDQLKDCIQCYMNGLSGTSEKRNVFEKSSQSDCQDRCKGPHSVSLVDRFKYNTADLLQDYGTCSFRDDNDFCLFKLAYWKDDDEIMTVQVERRKECPEKVNLYALVGGLVGGIVTIGIVLLVVFKAAVAMYDRRQVKRFREEISKAVWQNTGTPVNRPMSMIYRNPKRQKND